MKNTKILVVGICLASTILIVVLAFSFLLALRQSIRNAPNALSEAERRCLLSLDDLPGNVQPASDPKLCEEWTRSDYGDGSMRLKYHFDAEEDPSTSEIFTFTCRVKISSLEAQAVDDFRFEKKLAGIIDELSKGTTATRRDELLQLGDERFVIVYANDTEKTGVAAAVRAKNTVIGLTVIGHCIDDKQALESMFSKALTAVEQYRGQAKQ